MSKSRADDERILKILHLSEVEGLSAAEIARQLRGMTRNSVLGVLFRIRQAADAVPCACKKKRNRDGGMPKKWWAA